MTLSYACLAHELLKCPEYMQGSSVAGHGHHGALFCLNLIDFSI